NVHDYGAAGDGTTDDTAAVAAAFAAAAVAGGSVVFVAGKTYLVTAELTISGMANVHVRGNGATIRARLTQDETVWEFAEAVGVVIDDLVFDGGRSVTGFGSHVLSFGGKGPQRC